MNRVTAAWITVVFLAGFAGYAIGTSHNKPRFVIASQLVDEFLKEESITAAPNTGNTTNTSNTTNTETMSDTNGEKIKKKFEKYEEEYEFDAKENWTIKNQDIPVYVIYDIRNDEVIITCKMKDEHKKKCIK